MSDCLVYVGEKRTDYLSDVINIGNVSSHIALKSGVCDFSYMASFSFYILFKFDGTLGEISLDKTGHKF